jgi:hypothetical protein
MKRMLSWLCGVAGGAAGMYFFDPRLGGHRRSLTRDRMTRASHQFADFLNAAGRDVAHRWQGLLAECSAMFSTERAADATVVARVRSKLGRCVSHPRSIEVTAVGGRVILTGRVAEEEVPGLLRAVAAVRGVGDVENRLELQREAGRETSPSPESSAVGERGEWSQAHWSPAVRLAAGIAGAMLVRNGCTRRFPVACALGTVGLGLLARAVTNRPLWTAVATRHRPRKTAHSPADAGAISGKLQETWPF